MDGRSFDAVWSVLGLSGSSLPGHNHRQALAEVKDQRNKIAHGDEEVVVVGASKTLQELHVRIGQVEEAVEALDLALDEWFAQNGWRI